MITVEPYDCWFQKRGLDASMDEFRPALRTIRVTGGPALEHAACELALGLRRCFDIEAAVTQAAEAGPAAGADAGAAAAVTLAIRPDSGAGGSDEGFRVQTEGGAITVSAATERGVLYGVYRFISLLARAALAPRGVVEDTPRTSLRLLNHWDNIDGTVERGYAGRSLFFEGNAFSWERGRVSDYARLLASVGINAISINNVNVRGDAKKCILSPYLEELAALAAVFRPFGIRLLLSVNFASPCLIGGLDTADPQDEEVAAWWRGAAATIYQAIPDLLGFLVKADSESEPGPFQYGRTHACGANMLARALAPHGGQVFWRCFVYNCAQDWRDQTTDRARAAYDHFMPLDGAFDQNVLLQIKHGPFDFQVREPVSPLFGALKKTRHVMEWQITQEYTGQQIDLCFLPSLWADVLNFDTGYDAEGRPAPEGRSLTIRQHIGVTINALAAVSNTGRGAAWTGHPLAQANLYSYGRLTWNPALSPEELAREWSELTFGRGEAAAVTQKMLLASYPAYEAYTAPFGVCFMVQPATHYGPNIEGYEFSKWGTYHRAGREAIGIDRAARGTGFTEQYAPRNAALFSTPEHCPENLLLFFHRARYDHRMKNGETLLQNIYNQHFEGYEAACALLDDWLSLERALAPGIFLPVKERLEQQLLNAREWRDQVNTYFLRRSGIPDKKGRTIYE